MGKYELTTRQRLWILKSDLDADYMSFEKQYKDLNDFFLPSRGRFCVSTDSNRGDRRNHKIINNVGYLASRTLEAGMQAGMTSAARLWHRLGTPDSTLSEYGSVREWLDLVNLRIETYFGRSNLYQVLPTAYGDLGVFGTAAIFMDSDWESVFTFQSFPLGSYRIAKDRRGRVNVFYREFRMTVRQIIDTFGREDGKNGKPDWSIFSQRIRDLYERGNYEQWIEVCHVIEPNERHRPGNPFSWAKKFVSRYYERDCAEHEQEKYLRQKGYDFFPVLVPRWRVTGQDVYATDCPGMAALGDNKQLQASEKRHAQAVDKMTNPALLGSPGLKNSRVSLLSGDITYKSDDNDKLEPLHEVRLDLSHLTEKIEKLEDQINKAFFVDVFLPILENPRADRTATEVNQIKDERMLAMGPVLEQLNQDVLDPLIDNAFLLLHEAGLIPPAPEEIRGQELKVEYVSVLAQAQKLAGIGGMERLLSTATALNQIAPNTLAKVDWNEYVDQYADSLGISPKIIRSDEKVAELMNAQTAAAEKQQTIENIGQVAGAARDLAGADLESDSALSRLIGQSRAGQLTPTSV